MVSTKILGNHLRLLAPPRLFCLKYKGLCGEPELKDSPKDSCPKSPNLP